MAKKKAETPQEEIVPTSNVKGDRLKALMSSQMFKGLQKEFGGSILSRASECESKREFYIPTGIFQLDYALGGGFRAGGIHIAWGEKSGGKTTTLLKAVANAQCMCSRCYTFPDEDGNCSCKNFRELVAAVIDVEGTLDLPWARTLGVDTDSLLLSVPDFAEQSLDIAEQLLRSGSIDLLVMDSIAFMTPKKEIEKSTSDETPGLQARILGKGIRKFVAALNFMGNQTGSRPTVLFTNQTRMKLGVMFGDPTTTSGGKAPGFSASSEIKMWPGKYEMDEVSGLPLAALMNYRIEKNKAGGSPKMEGDYKLALANTEFKRKGTAFDEEFLVKTAERLSIVTGAGSHWSCLDQTFGAKSAVVQRAMVDPMFKSLLVETTLKAKRELEEGLL